MRYSNRLKTDNKKDILKEFYRNELIGNEEVIDNSCKAISIKLDLDYIKVRNFLAKEFNKKYKQFKYKQNERV